MKREVNILIIDDEESQAENLRDIMDEEEYLVDIAYNGTSGLDLCRENKYDIAFVDIKLPDILGNEVAKSIMEVSPSTECILMTGYASLESARDAVQQKGIVAYEIKPLDIEHIIQLVRDIIKHKNTEQALSESERRYREMTELLPDMIYEFDNSLNITYLNRTAMEILGFADNEFSIGIHLSQIMSVDDILKVKNATDQTSNYIPNINISEVKIFRKDQPALICESRSSLIKDEAGEIIGFRGVLNDITKRKTAEQVLLTEIEKLSVTLSSIGDGVIALDIDGKIIFCNDMAAKLTGYLKDETIGKSLTDIFKIVNNESNQDVMEIVNTVLQTGKPNNLNKGSYLNSKDGTRYIIADSFSPIHTRNNKIIGVVIIFRDNTERLQIEEEQLKINKLESIGQLAGGIAHDFNNILTVIMGNITLLKMHASPGDYIFERLEDSENASLKARDLTKQLLTFSHGGTPLKRRCSIAGLLKKSSHIALKNTKSRCELSIADNIWTVNIDEGLIRQVIKNLLLNADQAMPEGNLIKIIAENVVIDNSSFLPLKNDNYVLISIVDKGTGIPKENQNKIFDPYFTTKHEHSGLGLTIAYSIIKNHDGYISVKSEDNSNTIFYIYLPAICEPSKEAPVCKDILYQGKGNILVMDDEVMIRDILSRMLKSIGYNAVVVENGEQAIEVYKDEKDKGRSFDAVILDITVHGGMGGEEAIKILRKIDPDIKAIVSSGYSNAPIMSDYKSYGFNDFIPKPYRVKELSKLLNKVLTS